MGKPLNYAVIVSDTHCGCQLGLYPCDADIRLDNGGAYQPNLVQQVMWGWWREFWDEWVPDVTKGNPYAVVVNGDLIDGVHHNSVGQLTHNLDVHRQIAVEVFRPIVKLCNGHFFVVRGTEAHGGQAGCNEESIARELEARPDSSGKFSRYQLPLRIGRSLVHIKHFIPGCSSQDYMNTAPTKIFNKAHTEASKWHREAPQAIVRSHRHVPTEARISTEAGYGYAIVTAGWQLATSFVQSHGGGEFIDPVVGGVVLYQHPDQLYPYEKTWKLEPEREETA